MARLGQEYLAELAFILDLKHKIKFLNARLELEIKTVGQKGKFKTTYVLVVL